MSSSGLAAATGAVVFSLLVTALHCSQELGICVEEIATSHRLSKNCLSLVLCFRFLCAMSPTPSAMGRVAAWDRKRWNLCWFYNRIYRVRCFDNFSGVGFAQTGLDSIGWQNRCVAVCWVVTRTLHWCDRSIEPDIHQFIGVAIRALMHCHDLWVFWIPAFVKDVWVEMDCENAIVSCDDGLSIVGSHFVSQHWHALQLDHHILCIYHTQSVLHLLDRWVQEYHNQSPQHIWGPADGKHVHWFAV